ncbi:MAG: BON domain-containing protein [Chloroflexota bacterium]
MGMYGRGYGPGNETIPGGPGHPRNGIPDLEGETGIYPPGSGPYGAGAPGGFGTGDFGTFYHGTTGQLAGSLSYTDSDIQHHIEHAIDNDQQVPSAAQIEVKVDNGTASLTGTVRHKRTKLAAGHDAWLSPGVTDVRNQIKVEGRAGKKS